MPLILIDVLPSGQAIINTDGLITARVIDGEVRVFMTNGHDFAVPHESPERLYDEMADAVPLEQEWRTEPLPKS